MATRNPQTQAKRAREAALREKRERKQAKKAEVAAQKLAATNGQQTEEEPTETPDDEA